MDENYFTLSSIMLRNGKYEYSKVNEYEKFIWFENWNGRNSKIRKRQKVFWDGWQVGQMKLCTFCCSLLENILSLTPTSKSLTQKYIHFIQSTFISAISNHLHRWPFHSTSKRPLTPFYHILGIIKFQLHKNMLHNWNIIINNVQ